VCNSLEKAINAVTPYEALNNCNIKFSKRDWFPVSTDPIFYTWTSH
ncbi:unnamed protein product, partial [Prunus brigantina]